MGAHMTKREFIRSFWEQKPKLFRADSTSARSAATRSLPDRAAIDVAVRELESKGIAFQWGADVNAVRYVARARQMPSQAESGRIVRRTTLWKLLDSQGYTLQVHQPQRFDQRLQHLCFALEQELGCPVGTNAYITPPGTQGLAPHFDDVELFICQTEGTKHWKVYSPPTGWQLAHKHSRDLEQAELGKLLLDVTLKPGDVLYMPRGTVHQASAQGSLSMHITVSTFQCWSPLDLATATLKAALGTTDGRTRPALPLCRGWPIGLLSSSDGPARDRSTAVSAARALRLAAKQLEGKVGALWAAAATDELATDFLSSRMPPPPRLLRSWARGPRPRFPTDLLSRRGPSGLCRIVPTPATEGPPVVRRIVALVHCLRNRVSNHMMGARLKGRPPLTFPAEWAPVLKRVLGKGCAGSEALSVASLAQDSEAGGPGIEDALQLADILWSEGTVTCTRVDLGLHTPRETKNGDPGMRSHGKARKVQSRTGQSESRKKRRKMH